MAGKLDNYVSAVERNDQFHQKYPDGVITTEADFSDEKYVRVKAIVFRTQDKLLATGHAESARGSRSEKVLEFTETVAVARALALGGFSASKSIASREEMEGFEESKRGEVPFPTAAEAAAEIRGIGEDEAAQLEPLVRDWLAGSGDKEKLKMKLISLGVTEPNVALRKALAQIPSAKKASDLLSWMGKEGNTLTPDELADALIEEGVAVEKA